MAGRTARGCPADGQVLVFTNTLSHAGTAPELTAGRLLLAHGQVLSVGSQAAPFVHDWDEDGLPDLLCGAEDGCLYYFRNTGSPTEPVYHPQSEYRPEEPICG